MWYDCSKLPPNDWDWEQWKKDLDKHYRYHLNRRHIIALKILDEIYDDWDIGKRTTEMIDGLSSIWVNRLDEMECDVEW